MHQIALRTSSVVLLGVFDVRSFTPTALLKNDVLSVSDATSADGMTIVPTKASVFEIDGLSVTAQPERIQVLASAPPYIRTADIPSKAIRENTEFPSRVTAVGFNLQVFVAMADHKARDRLGRRLAPIDVWGKWSEQLAKAASFPADDPRHSGMMSLVMRLPSFDDRASGWTEVRVEPSIRTKGPEVFISVNDHYGMPIEPEKAEKTEPLALLEIVETRFDAAMQKADDIVASLLEEAK